MRTIFGRPPSRTWLKTHLLLARNLNCKLRQITCRAVAGRTQGLNCKARNENFNLRSTCAQASINRSYFHTKLLQVESSIAFSLRRTGLQLARGKMAHIKVRTPEHFLFISSQSNSRKRNVLSDFTIFDYHTSVSHNHVKLRSWNQREPPPLYLHD